MLLQQKLVPTNSTILIACSGGADSVALTLLLQQLAPYKAWHIYVCHVQHHIRGYDAEKDALFVENLCESLALPFKRIDVDAPRRAKLDKISLEEAARKLRYEELRAYAKKIGAQAIVTGHHLNDQAETVLLNLLRGTGTRGLRGMLAQNGLLVRPLLGIPKADLEAYCQAQGFGWCTDNTNADVVYKRNSIRHELIPFLEKYNPQIQRSLAETAKSAAQDEAYLQECAENYLNKNCSVQSGNIVLKVAAWQDVPLALAGRIVQNAFYWAIGNQKLQLERKHIEKILKLLHKKRSGLRLDLPGISVKLEYDNLIFGPQGIKDEKEFWGQTLTVPGEVQLSNGKILSATYCTGEPDKNQENFLAYPADLVTDIIEVRNRKDGDILWVPGVGHQKLKKYLIDRKIPVSERNKLVLVASGNNILWIVGKQSVDFMKQKKYKKWITFSIIQGG